MDEHWRRWEWQSFADEFADHKLPWVPEFETTEHTYVVSPDSETRMAICDNRISVDRLEDCRDGITLWHRTVDAAFPLCQRNVRDALRQFPVAPPTLYRPEYTPLAFLTDIATCTDGLRVAGLRGIRRCINLDGCILERAAFSVAGQLFQSTSVTGADPDLVRAVLRRYHLDGLDPASIVTLLKQVFSLRQRRNNPRA